jgi:cytochrome c oxidase subunit 2
LSLTTLRLSAIALLAAPLCSAISASETPKSDDNHKGALLYETCKACHGPKGEGNPAIEAPPIAGLPEWYLISTLHKFKHGIRGAHHQDVAGLKMRPMARQLRDESQIKAVSKHISKLPSPMPQHKLHGDPKKGKALYMACAACHGAKAEGNVTMKAPPLAGLPDWYISNQLDKFKAGLRGAHPKDKEGASMRPMAMGLADRQAMDHVAAYISSLTGPVQGPKKPDAHH